VKPPPKPSTSLLTLGDLVREMRVLAKQGPLDLPGAAAELAAALPGLSEDQQALRAQCLALALRWLGAPTDPRAPGAGARYEHAMARLMDMPAFSNIAELALSTGTHLVVHRVLPPAADTVDATDLHSLPAEAPKLMQRAWILEAQYQRGHTLFGDTFTLAGVPRPDGQVMLIGLDLPDGIHVMFWRPMWGDELEVTPHAILGDIDGTLGEQEQQWATQAARFSVMLGLLLEAENTPIEHRDGPGRLPGNKQPKPGQGWTVRDVSVRSVKISEQAPSPVPSTTPAAAGAPSTAGRQEETVLVRGHVKRQRHGPGNSLVKWVYIVAHEARRWVTPEVRVVVS
jgi:hypothetical protein